MSTETSCHFGHLLLVSNHRLQQFLKNPLFYLFPYKSTRDQIWPCHKIGQGQLRVIIWKNLIVLEHPMLHTNFQGHRPFGSGEEDFLRFLPYIGVAAILVIWPGPVEQTFIPPSHGGAIWNLILIGLVVSERKIFKECGRRMDNGVCPYYKLTYEPKGSIELKRKRALGQDLFCVICNWAVWNFDDKIQISCAVCLCKMENLAVTFCYLWLTEKLWLLPPPHPLKIKH